MTNQIAYKRKQIGLGGVVVCAMICTTGRLALANVVHDSECDPQTKTLCEKACISWEEVPGHWMSSRVVSNQVIVALCKTAGSVPGTDCPKQYTVCGQMQVFLDKKDCVGVPFDTTDYPVEPLNNDCFNTE